MTEARKESQAIIRWDDSFLLELGAYVCLLAVAVNLICAWDFNRVGFRSIGQRLSLAVWE